MADVHDASDSLLPEGSAPEREVAAWWDSLDRAGRSAHLLAIRDLGQEVPGRTRDVARLGWARLVGSQQMVLHWYYDGL